MDKSVFDEFYPKIYNYVYYRVLHKETTQDITGEAFYKAISNEKCFDERRASYSTWLFTIAHNCVANYFRDKKDIIPLDDINVELVTDSGIDDDIIDDDDFRKLHELLKLLPERERTILALRFWGELSYNKIASQMELSASNVGVILKRTIEKLRSLW